MDKPGARLVAVVLSLILVVVLRALVWPLLAPRGEVIVASPQELAAAADESIPYVAKLGTPDCIHCRRMQPIWQELAREYAGRVRFYEVNLAVHPQLAATFAVRAVPTIVFFAAGGEVRHLQVGYMDGAQVRAALREHQLIGQ